MYAGEIFRPHTTLVTHMTSRDIRKNDSTPTNCDPPFGERLQPSARSSIVLLTSATSHYYITRRRCLHEGAFRHDKECIRLACFALISAVRRPPGPMEGFITGGPWILAGSMLGLLCWASTPSRRLPGQKRKYDRSII